MQTGMLILVGGMAIGVVGCHSDTRQDQARTDIIEYNEHQPIEWTPDGQHLLIKNRWWYTPVDKTFTAIAQPLAALKSTDGYWDIRPSSDSRRLMWWDTQSDRMLISKINESPTAVISIPTWLSLEAGQQENRFNTPFWLDNKNIFVQQTNLQPVSELGNIACGMFNTESQQWVRLQDKACIQAALFTVGGVEYLQGQTYLVYSSEEGHSGLEVMNIDVGKIQQTVHLELTFGTVGTFGTEPPKVKYRDIEHIWLLFRCELDPTQERQECAEHSTGPALYSWAVSKKKLRLLQLNLPNHIAMSHVHDQIAWLDKEIICVGKPGEKETISCTPLPAIQL